MTYWQKFIILLVLKLGGTYQFHKFKLIDRNKKKVITITGYETIVINHYG